MTLLKPWKKVNMALLKEWLKILLWPLTDFPIPTEAKQAVMLSQEEIIKLGEDIDLDIVKEAIRQAEVTMQDELESRRDIDQKAVDMLRIYLTGTIAVISMFLYFIKAGTVPVPVSGWFILYSLIFYLLLFFNVLAAWALLSSQILLIYVLKPAGYHGIGYPPITWLETDPEKEKIRIKKGDPTGKIELASVVLFHYHDRIESNEQVNIKKAHYLNQAIPRGMYALICIPLSIFVWVLLA